MTATERSTTDGIANALAMRWSQRRAAARREEGDRGSIGLLLALWSLRLDRPAVLAAQCPAE